MSAVTASEARSNLYRLIDEVAPSHHPLLITGKRGNAVLVAEEDWNAIQETLHLLSIPGMRESIHEGIPLCQPSCVCRSTAASVGKEPPGQHEKLPK